MRVPQLSQWKGLLSGIGIFITGAIVGSAVFMSIYVHNYNYLVEQKMELLKEKSNLEQNISSLEQNRNKRYVINQIDVHAASSSEAKLDKVTLGEIEKRVERDIRTLEGKKTAVLSENPELVRLLVNHIYPQIDKKDYVVHLQTMVVINSKLTVWVSAEEYSRD